MPNGPRKLILINSGSYDYAEVELSGSLQLVGPNNTGKTTLISTLQFLYIDDRSEMRFAGYSADETAEYYFPNQFSYILFECLGVRGTFVLGWRGNSKISSGDPQRFYYEGEFLQDDFFEAGGKVREPDDVKARLSLKHFKLIKAARHRELLLLPTKGEPDSAGIVALRQPDNFHNFRETFKNLLTLSSVTQDQMRDRLLMLAGMSENKLALDIRKVFGQEYDDIVRRRQELRAFKGNKDRIELLLSTCEARSNLRSELMRRWTDLRSKKDAFTGEHQAGIEKLKSDALAASQQAAKHRARIAKLRNELGEEQQRRGGLAERIKQLADQAAELGDFGDTYPQTRMNNLDREIGTLERALDDAEQEDRTRVEEKIDQYGKQAEQLTKVAEHFDRALVTILREHFGDEELAPLSQLFSSELLQTPVGGDGITVRDLSGLVRALRTVHRRIDAGIYSDENVDIPVGGGPDRIATLADPSKVRQQLKEINRDRLKLQTVLRTIIERQERMVALEAKRTEASTLRRKIFRWERYLEEKGKEAQLTADVAAIDEANEKTKAEIGRLETEAAGFDTSGSQLGTTVTARQTAHDHVMRRFSECKFPDYPGLTTKPFEVIPEAFDLAVEVFLSQQKRIAELDEAIRSELSELEKIVGSEYAGVDQDETIELFRQGVDALEDRETAVARDWEHQFQELRATFDQVIRTLDDIRSAADKLKRSLSNTQVSNLKAMSMDLEEQRDIVDPLRMMATFEQPGLFDDGSSAEARLSALRERFVNNPLLRYTDLFNLTFTVVGEDGKTHRYHDFTQVESHGTTITIKVLFNLLVLRSLLREDANKSLLCEIPFFLDEIHSLDGVNRHAIVDMARRLGFIAITAAPSSVSEVDTLYYLKPKKGRIVLRRGHRVGVKNYAGQRE